MLTNDDNISLLITLLYSKSHKRTNWYIKNRKNYKKSIILLDSAAKDLLNGRYRSKKKECVSKTGEVRKSWSSFVCLSI